MLLRGWRRTHKWSTQPQSQPFLWHYDALYDKWDSKTIRQDAGVTIGSVSFGAGVVIDDRAIVFYCDGWFSNANSRGYTGNRRAQANILSYDMIEDRWKIDTFIDIVPRAEGVMFYTPASG